MDHLREIKAFTSDLLGEGSIEPGLLDMVKYQLNYPGKLLRSRMIVELSELHNSFSDDIITFAASVELLHNASLVLDDIQDKDGYRRGRLAAWKKYSMEQAINLAVLLFSLSFKCTDKLGNPELTKMQSGVVKDLANGQFLDIELRNKGFTIEEYLNMARLKTGALFRFALAGVAMITGNQIEKLDNLGEIYGTMFQVRDDIHDSINNRNKTKISPSSILFIFQSNRNEILQSSVQQTLNIYKELKDKCRNYVQDEPLKGLLDKWLSYLDRGVMDIEH